MTLDSKSVRGLWIGGRECPAASGETFNSENPATGELLCPISLADRRDVEDAIAAAKDGLATWSQTPPAERSRVLRRAADILYHRNDELAHLEVLDTGKPIAEARVVDVVSGAECLEYFAGMAATLQGEHIDLGASAFAYTRREPLGVCVGIGAWNYPLQIACWKSAPALACGNAMIFKPSELSPLTALELGRIYKEAGLPDGVFNVLQGGAEVGRALIKHPDVAKVSLTGEVGTGRKVMADAAAGLKHVTMELGGKSPLLIFDDADIDNAVSAAMLGNFYTQGEICSNATRVFVQRSAAEAFKEKLLGRISRLKLGNPLDLDTDVGPMISAEHFDKVMEYIEIGKGEGATLLCGGQAATELPKGLARIFVEPTVFEARDDMRIAREEIFGPVMSLLIFDEEVEAIARANDTEFGLAAGVFTKDITRAHRVVAKLQAGTCWINNYNITPIEMPFGGSKQSGIGRENGHAAIEHYSQRKSVYVELGDVDCPYK